MPNQTLRCLRPVNTWRLFWTGLSVALLCASAARAQRVMTPDELAAIKRARPVEEGRHAAPSAPRPIQEWGVVELEGGPGLGGLDGGERGVDLYTGLQASGNGFWSFGESVFWALDDGLMGPVAAAAGGGHVTGYQFAFGLHADFAGDIIRPYVIISFYNAPPDPVAGAGNPVVDPPTPVSSIAWLFTPVTLPSAGTTGFQSPVINLSAFGFDFDLDESFYVEILPMEWSGYPGGGPVFDPDVHAVFTGPAALTYGANQDRMWVDTFAFSLGVPTGDGDGFYDHPAELDLGGRSPLLDRSGVRLRGDPCVSSNVLQLDIHHPVDECVQPGETVTVTLSQSCLPGLVRGYQAFLSFDPSRLVFGSGAYLLPVPYGLPIIVPIAALAGDIDLAAGINDFTGQLPTSAMADLSVLTFTAGLTEGSTQVVFRPHDPPTRFSDPTGAEVVPSLTDSPTVCIDGTAPNIICPPDPAPQCSLGIPGAATNYFTFVSQGGVATDTGCGSGVSIVRVGDVSVGGTGCPAGPFVLHRTYRAIDCAGNQADCTQIITVNDTMGPTFVACPADIVRPNAPDQCGATVSWTPPTASDNCSSASVMQTGGPPPGSFFAVGGPYPITYSATDGCGNMSACSFTVTVNDTQLPTITCPPNRSVHADAGGCAAAVTIPPPIVADNCAVAGVVNSFNGTSNASGVYPQGMTTVIWTVTDVHANTAQCSQTVTVSAFNELAVSVQLSPTMATGPLARCITFELWGCPDAAPDRVEPEDMLFTGGVASQTVLIECGAYDCITARDALHTLRRTDEAFGISGNQYLADFTGDPAGGGDWLIGGNLNDDFWIDILDFGLFSFQWATNYGSGDTECPPPVLFPNADVNGTGVVTTADFTFIQINFLKSHEANCCDQPGRGGGEGGDGPLTRISLGELRQRGLGRLEAGDLNRDGWLDESDIVAFLVGERPRAATSATSAGTPRTWE